MSYRAPPAVLPSLRDVDAEQALAPEATHGPLSFSAFCAASAREPFILSELREERRARGRAAAAPCPRPSRDQGGGGDNSATLALIRAMRALVR